MSKVILQIMFFGLPSANESTRNMLHILTEVVITGVSGQVAWFPKQGIFD